MVAFILYVWYSLHILPSRAFFVGFLHAVLAALAPFVDIALVPLVDTPDLHALFLTRMWLVAALCLLCLLYAQFGRHTRLAVMLLEAQTAAHA